MNERDMKLVQWLNEAHAKEAELEAALNSHIRLTQKASYKKRLQQHLKETRDHKKRVAARIKRLGGSPSSGPDLPGVPDAVGEVAGKAVAAVKGQVGTARAALTEQAETHVRNAQEELREEHVEIAIYTRLETLAQEVGDRETAQLAKDIRRDEERMAKFLDAELRRLVKDVVRAEIPRAQRTSGATRSGSRRATAARSTSRSRGAARAAGTASKTTGTRSTTKKATGARSTAKAGGTRSTAKSGGTRSTASKPGGTRSTSSKAGGTRSTAKAGGTTRRAPSTTGSRARSSSRS